MSVFEGAFFKGWFSPKGLLSLGLLQKTPEVVLKDETAWKINSYQISIDILGAPQACRAGPHPALRWLDPDAARFTVGSPGSARLPWSSAAL